MSFSTPSRMSRLNLSSLLADFTPNTHTWRRLKAALSVHRKGKGNTLIYFLPTRLRSLNIYIEKFKIIFLVILQFLISLSLNFLSAAYPEGCKSLGNGNSWQIRLGRYQPGSFCHPLSEIAAQRPPVTAGEPQFTGTHDQP